MKMLGECFVLLVEGLTSNPFRGYADTLPKMAGMKHPEVFGVGERMFNRALRRMALAQA